MNLTAARPGSDSSTAGAPGAPLTKAEGHTAPPRIPDTTVLDQDGRKLNFYTDLVKGKTVAINFIFTTCNGVCPPMTATFRKVQRDMAERVGRDVELISVSVDPTTDVPERLKSFAAKFGAGPGWTFVTGSKPEIDRLLKSLGTFAPNKTDHTPMILIGNEPAGYWTRTYGLAPASTIVKAINEVAGRNAAEGGPDQQVPLPAAVANNSQEWQVERRAGAAADKRAGQPGAEKGVKSLAEASAGYFPNSTLRTQDDKPVHFYDDLLKGKVVMINFMFTTCTGVCQPMTANLAKVQKYLGERVGREVTMISISVDPATDTPAVLKNYTEKFKVQPGWYFLTGEKQDVDKVLAKLGGQIEDRAQHTSVLIVGNEATGEWMKMHAMSNPSQIAGAVTQLLASGKSPKAAGEVNRP